MDKIEKYITDCNLEPFPVDKRGFYHNMVSLIISQRIRFFLARRIRSRIFQILGSNNLNRIMTLTPEQRMSVKISDNKWQIIKEFDQAYQIHGKDYDFTKFKGIGSWTVNCAKIMVGDYSPGFITTNSSVNSLVYRISGLKEQEIISHLKTLPREKSGKIFSILWNSIRMKDK